MPPTIHSEKDAKDSKDRKKEREKDKRPESLICRLKYNNTLPDIPFDPKFLVYPFESNRFIQYNATSLERNYKHELLTEHDAGVEIDLVHPDIFKVDHRAKLHPSDERLLEDDAPSSADSKRSQRHNTNVSWLRKTEYISTEIYNKSNTKLDKAESRIGFNIKRLFKEEDVYRDRQSQVDAIEGTFTSVSQPIIEHYSKPGVTAVEVLPVLPDFDTWQHPCAQVIFDADPAPKNKSSIDQCEDINQAMIRGMVDETGDQFVAYFLPTVETKRKRKRDGDESIPYRADETYEYELTREYNWNVKNKTMSNYEENYFFVFRPSGVYYNELETRVRLSKRRKLAGGGAGGPTTKTRLLVTHRDFTDDELKSQAARLAMLEPEMEEDEEEEEDDDEEEEEEPGSEHEAVKAGDGDNDETERNSPTKPASEATSSSGLSSSDDEEDATPRPRPTDATVTKQAAPPVKSSVFSDSDDDDDDGSVDEAPANKTKGQTGDIFGSSSESDSD